MAFIYHLFPEQNAQQAGPKPFRTHTVQLPDITMLLFCVYPLFPNMSYTKNTSSIPYTWMKFRLTRQPGSFRQMKAFDNATHRAKS